ncbi:hypothetical protein AWB67_05816 [Caballeronia terrestris]|jgi:hypothetical protein|uniref:Uncharacterized protein n=2 Tax=Caballeronia TaxID=1827195 RepID=A0A158KJK3_9BURK|nr:hypothetical protein [Caballeronia terrestris]SAL81326.1 hypothetical protein AWB67_05816 [Caballeronia terrestris]
MEDLSPLDCLSIVVALIGFVSFVIQLVLLEREKRVTLVRLTKWGLLHASIVVTGLTILMLSKSSARFNVGDPDVSAPMRVGALSTKDFVAFAIIYLFIVWRSVKTLKQPSNDDVPRQ